MKGSIKRIAVLLIAALLICSSISAYADGRVSYGSGADKFIFEPGSDSSPTDLFNKYKELMPGDSISQGITVRNDASNEVKVKLYVRSRGADADSAELLSKLHLRVAKSENNKMAYMFDASADQTDGMTDWVYLGTLYSGGEVDLVLTLDVPLELDDAYQDAIGYINWDFRAEELPVEPDDPVPPETGDNGRIFLYAAIASFVGTVLILLFSKRKKQAEK